MTRSPAPLFLVLSLTACAARNPAPTPAWGDDSRSQLAAQGTSVAPEKSEAPPQVKPAATPEEGLRPAAAMVEKASAEDGPMPARPPVVRLLDPGREPRRVLRYRVAQPRTDEMSMEMSTTMTTAMAGGPQMPEMTLPITRLVTTATLAPAENGVLLMSTRLTDADSVAGSGPQGAMLADRVRPEMRKLVGMATESRINSRGMVLESKTTIPPGADASGASDGAENPSDQAIVLPAEAIGIGARWEVETDLRKRGLTMHQVSRYQLRELAGSRLGLDVSSQMSAPPQEMKMGAGTAQVENVRGSSLGAITTDLDTLIPRLATFSLDLDMAMRAQGMALSMRMKMGLKMQAGR